MISDLGVQGSRAREALDHAGGVGGGWFMLLETGVEGFLFVSLCESKASNTDVCKVPLLT